MLIAHTVTSAHYAFCRLFPSVLPLIWQELSKEIILNFETCLFQVHEVNLLKLSRGIALDRMNMGWTSIWVDFS